MLNEESAGKHNILGSIEWKKIKRRNSKWCIFVVLLTQLSGFIPFGMNLTLLNPSTPAIEVFINETFKKRFNVSASSQDTQVIIVMSQSFLIVGTGVGAFGVRPVIAKLSRRHSLMIANVIGIFSSILMSLVAYLCQSYEVLIFGRFLNGVSRGFLFTTIPLYIAEIVARRTLAAFQSLSICLLQIGSSLGNFIGHPDVLGGIYTWPYLMATPALFSILYLIFLPWLPETPTFLLLKSVYCPKSMDTENLENKEAYVLLCELRSNNKMKTKMEYEQLCKELDEDSKLRKATFFEIFSTKNYRKQIVGCILLQLSAQFAGLQAVIQYTNTILEVAGVRANQTTFFSIGLFFLLALLIGFFVPFLHRYGSKKLLISGLLVIAFSLILLTISTFLTSSSMIYLSVPALLLYFIGAGCGPLLAILSLPSEITTSRSRPMVFWFSGIVFWMVGTIVVFAAPFALSSMGGYTYIIFIILVLLDVIYIWIFIPNTHKKSVSEIQEKLMFKS